MSSHGPACGGSKTDASGLAGGGPSGIRTASPRAPGGEYDSPQQRTSPAAPSAQALASSPGLTCSPSLRQPPRRSPPSVGRRCFPRGVRQLLVPPSWLLPGSARNQPRRRYSCAPMLDPARLLVAAVVDGRTKASGSARRSTQSAPQRATSTRCRCSPGIIMSIEGLHDSMREACELLQIGEVASTGTRQGPSRARAVNSDYVKAPCERARGRDTLASI